MKTLLGILLGLVLLSLASCTEPTAIPTSEGMKESNFKMLDKFDEGFGVVRIYSYGTDTLYIVEGRSSSYPVGVTVK